jgi:hypothetical protein
VSVAMRSSAPNQNYAYHSTIIARVKGLAYLRANS